jgi:NAD(P)-dependent dehydrogenase (short-subunit alcohol dehydrogenase family)
LLRIANKQGGSIVNIASIIGKIGNLGQANYSASKGGVISFSKTAAKELARDKIRVNTILPGFINTPMAQAVPEKVKEKIYPQIPLGRFGEPEEIADMVVFLASDRAKYVTGSVIEVTGGYNM